MSDPFFFSFAFAPTIAEIASLGEASYDAADPALANLPISRLASIEAAGKGDAIFYEHGRYKDKLRRTGASACFIREAHKELLPAGVAALLTDAPYKSFMLAAALLAPQALRPDPLFGKGVDAAARVHPHARLEPGVSVEPGAAIGADVEIGSGSIIGANAVIGAGVRIGRDCFIGAGASVFYALIGDRVILHPGVRIGQDGFGFARVGHKIIKAPQLGRVIIQDDVEIGANSTIDRGALNDTVIGESAKIDNLVHIGHNVMVGRCCFIVAQVGIAGSTEIEDGVAIGGQAGVLDHLRIGAGARIAAQAGVMRDVPAGASLAGAPARELRSFLKKAARDMRGPRK